MEGQMRLIDADKFNAESAMKDTETEEAEEAEQNDERTGN